MRPAPTYEVEVSGVVWSRTRRYGASEFPVGGVVVAITEGIDPETGEVVRGVRTLDTMGGRLVWQHLDMDDIDPATVSPPSEHVAVRRARDIWRELAEGRTTALTARDLERVEVAYRLVFGAAMRRPVAVEASA